MTIADGIHPCRLASPTVHSVVEIWPSAVGQNSGTVWLQDIHLLWFRPEGVSTGTPREEDHVQGDEEYVSLHRPADMRRGLVYRQIKCN